MSAGAGDEPQLGSARGSHADARCRGDRFEYSVLLANAYVYSEDLERAWAFAERVETEAVGVNVVDTTDLQAPFGGWKLSGLGRELGQRG